ncbi:MAG TPA: hypothetical protein VI731_09770, partial [Bacteroidia bacterium]|nr:hypothetical protein [Bacteroidia bacterium]
MKKLYMLASAIIFATAAFAQSFTTNTNAPIRDNQYTAVPVVVTGLPAVADSSFGLCSVTFSLVHTYVGDLDLWLISPS